MAEGPADDPSVLDDHELWRRVPAFWVVYDDNRKQYRPTSAAFQNSTGFNGMSVVLGTDHGDPEGAVSSPNHSTHSLASVSARFARGCSQTLSRAPEPDEPHHGHVAGAKTRSISRKFAAESDWRVLRAPSEE